MKIRLLFIMGIILIVGLTVQAPLDAYYQTGQAEGLDYSYQPPAVPAPPQSVLVDTQNIQGKMANQDVDTEVIHYTSFKPAKEILRFYKRSLKKAGWQLLDEAAKVPVAMISLTKDNKITANITAWDKGEQGSEIYISVAQFPEQIPVQRTSIKENQFVQVESEAPGKDPTWAPRYPGSSRRMYSENRQTGRVTVVYETDEPVETVVKFYSERMPNSGWWLKDNVKLEKIPGFGRGNYQNLVFEGWQGNCVVSVNKPQDLSKFGKLNRNLTAILLNFSPER